MQICSGGTFVNRIFRLKVAKSGAFMRHIASGNTFAKMEVHRHSISEAVSRLKAGRHGANIQLSGIRRSAGIARGTNQRDFEGRMEAAPMNQRAATEAARLRMASSVVTGFFRDMDRGLEEMKPKY